MYSLYGIEIVSALALNLVGMDMFLTEKSIKDCHCTYIQHGYTDIEKAVKFLEGEEQYYLSDGGYSRVYVRVSDGFERASVGLDSVSRKEVIEKWDKKESTLHYLLRGLEREIKKFFEVNRYF